MTTPGWEDFSLFHTPDNLIDLVRTGTSSATPECFVKEDILSRLRLKSHLQELGGTKLLYAMDHACLKSHTEPTVADVFTSTLHEIRTIVANALRDAGATVVLLRQTRQGSVYNPYPGDWPERGWAQLADDASTLIKVRTTFSCILPRKEAFRSPNVTDERVFFLNGQRHCVITATYLPNLKTLAQLMHFSSTQELLSACIEVMKGNRCMHQQGWLHNDIKPENGGVTKDENNHTRGVLLDLETARPQTFVKSLITTTEYSENEYYTFPNGTGYIDEARDAFAWGLTLLVLFTKIYISLNVHQKVRRSSCESDLAEITGNALAAVRRPEFGDIIKGLLRSRENGRWTLDMAIEKLEEVVDHLQ